MGRRREFDVDKALEAALAVFWQKGYEGSSFEDLTRATGVARPGLYSAFGNKRALFLKALDRYDAKYMTYLGEALAEPRIRDVIRRFFEGAIEVQTLGGHARGCAVVNGALACSDATEPIRQELIARQAETEHAWRARLERAVQEGELPPTTNCEMLATYIMAVNQGLGVQAKSGVPKAVLCAIADHVLATWPASLAEVEAEPRALPN
ncbi:MULTISPECIES: TetR/AcrR family transcriptional regulator [unclassified Sphingomonas]|uniref:TetR/AcrR family transcriptional regulator n=1 Tax=unclassified Sphingomonas TaxID=196159 RepID=UPI0007001A95|nr:MULTISPECIES: TetR/AcrR family transcriptional regulator [unclassified Sphingomonas]KQX24275.1 TetR family transcriptional regulator [Sphingomonas sp. Root1294]KQY69552.1 TetR family transcriptional regulator [Sphingomonas sp. Root50]KRB87480.1 TetR family transcriptional regulator [Sphingomonas sp. Root720]